MKLLSMWLFAAVVARAAATAKRPNIIFVLTDDQDLRLGSTKVMPHLQEVMGEGANMSNFFTHTPICCQSRAALLSGRFTHNIKSNSALADGCMHMNTSRKENPEFWQKSFVRALNVHHGYATGFFGKVLNDMKDYGCDGKHFADGIDRSFIMCKIAFYNSSWTNFTMQNGKRVGSMVKSGSAPEDYTTTMIGNASLAWMKDIIAQGPDHKPFFAWLGPHAPHLPSTPPPYHVDPSIANIPVQKDPSYGALSKDKHSWYPDQPNINEADAAAIATEHTNRLQSLVAVDDVIGQIREYLMSVDEWENTYFFYTSDHGYNLGQFRVDSKKTQVYDHNARVPMIIKGPGVAKGVELPLVTSMVDLGPTILEIAAGRATAVPHLMDGGSFAPMLHGKDSSGWRTAALIEYRSIIRKDNVDLCQTGQLSSEANDEHVSAYGYSADTELDEDGRPMLCASALSKAYGQPQPQHHFHDGPNNTFAGIRIIDSDNDLLYAEFVDGNNPKAWNFEEDQVNYRELYNVKEDYYMMKNIYNSASHSLKRSLSQRLQAAVNCQGGADCLKYLGGGSWSGVLTV